MSDTPAPATYTLAIDAMGGDGAPAVVIEGLQIAAERHPAARFLLVGDEQSKHFEDEDLEAK